MITHRTELSQGMNALAWSSQALNTVSNCPEAVRASVRRQAMALKRILLVCRERRKTRGRVSDE